MTFNNILGTASLPSTPSAVLRTILEKQKNVGESERSECTPMLTPHTPKMTPKTPGKLNLLYSFLSYISLDKSSPLFILAISSILLQNFMV